MVNLSEQLTEFHKKMKLDLIFTGGEARKTNLFERDKFICSTIGPELRKRDLFFVGIDVIGDYLTEINVTSPTGIREENLNNINIAKLFWEYLEKINRLIFIKSMITQFLTTYYMKNAR